MCKQIWRYCQWDSSGCTNPNRMIIKNAPMVPLPELELCSDLDCPIRSRNAPIPPDHQYHETHQCEFCMAERAANNGRGPSMESARKLATAIREQQARLSSKVVVENSKRVKDTIRSQKAIAGKVSATDRVQQSVATGSSTEKLETSTEPGLLSFQENEARRGRNYIPTDQKTKGAKRERTSSTDGLPRSGPRIRQSTLRSDCSVEIGDNGDSSSNLSASKPSSSSNVVGRPRKKSKANE